MWGTWVRRRRRKQFTVRREDWDSSLKEGDVIVLGVYAPTDADRPMRPRCIWTHDLRGFERPDRPGKYRRVGRVDCTDGIELRGMGFWRVDRIEEAPRGIRVRIVELFDEEVVTG